MAKLLHWVGLVEAKGLDEVRKTPSWHDEPLQGEEKESAQSGLTEPIEPSTSSKKMESVGSLGFPR